MNVSELIDQLDQLNRFDRLVPEGEGTVWLTLYLDGSWEMVLEMWGYEVARRDSDDGLFVLHYGRVEKANPEWVPDLSALVKGLNHLIASSK